jgi:biotin synthase
VGSRQPVRSATLTTSRRPRTFALLMPAEEPMPDTSAPSESFHGHSHTAAPPPPGVELRHDWSLAEVRAIYSIPLLDLVHRAQTVHRSVFQDNKVQLCSLLSIKTGGCSEDCAYCPQAARYKTGVKAEKLMAVPEVLAAATKARAAGATRFCMGAAWREVKDGPQFDSVLEMVRGVRAMGMEACATLGMLTDSQAKRLREAGLDAYNHNLDTSPEHYGDIISTRTYDDRLKTLNRVREAGISVCCGGIIGMGESVDDRCNLLRTLANQEHHPESVPVNALVAVEGTPLAEQPRIETVDMVRTIATARVLMPQSMVRLSAGRQQMNEEAQLLCMMAGANSLFFGEKLLTTGNPEYGQDMALLEKAGIRPLEPRREG